MNFVVVGRGEGKGLGVERGNNNNKGKRLGCQTGPPSQYKKPQYANVAYGRCSTNLGPPCSVNSA